MMYLAINTSDLLAVQDRSHKSPCRGSSHRVYGSRPRSLDFERFHEQRQSRHAGYRDGMYPFRYPRHELPIYHLWEQHADFCQPSQNPLL